MNKQLQFIQMNNYDFNNQLALDACWYAYNFS